MKKFLFKTLLYILLIFSLFGMLVTITNSGLRRSEFGNLKEWRELLEGKINADVLIQGSSRAWVQYNPTIIDTVLSTNSFNLGMDGAPFDIQYLRFKAYLENNKAPKLIIQNVDLDLLDTQEEFFQKYQFLPFLNNKYFENLLKNQELISFTDIYFPFMRYLGQPKAVQIGFSEYLGITHYQTEKYKGYAARHDSWDDSKFEQRKKRGKGNWKVNAEARRLFQHFIDECKDKNIKLVLVFAPIYYEITDLVVDFEASKQLYTSIANQNNITFLDYSLCEISYNKKFFYNMTHLNSMGSDLFSSKVCKDLQTKGVME